jgi:hypothetical protein
MAWPHHPMRFAVPVANSGCEALEQSIYLPHAKFQPEYSMRAATLALLAVGLLAAPSLQAASKRPSHARVVPLAAPACEFDADRMAFEIEGLKSQLMVTALACKTQDKYNAFMSRYQPDVARQEQALSLYFKRSYGKQYQKAYDEYITNLADIQEQDGLKAGTALCDNLPAMFDEVMSLHDSSELRGYINSKLIAQPITFQTCAGAPPPAAGMSHKGRHTAKASSKHT